MSFLAQDTSLLITFLAKISFYRRQKTYLALVTFEQYFVVNLKLSTKSAIININNVS